MALGICFFAEDSKNSGFNNDPGVWRKIAEAFKCGFYIIIDEKNTLSNYKDENNEFHVVKSLDEIKEIHTECKRIALWQNSKTKLDFNFVHPKDALYIVGRDNGGFVDDEIPTNNIRLDLQKELWGCNCIVALLVDRQVKTK